MSTHLFSEHTFFFIFLCTPCMLDSFVHFIKFIGEQTQYAKNITRDKITLKRVHVITMRDGVCVVKQMERWPRQQNESMDCTVTWSTCPHLDWNINIYEACIKRQWAISMRDMCVMHWFLSVSELHLHICSKSPTEYHSKPNQKNKHSARTLAIKSWLDIASRYQTNSNAQRMCFCFLSCCALDSHQQQVQEFLFLNGDKWQTNISACVSHFIDLYLNMFWMNKTHKTKSMYHF